MTCKSWRRALPAWRYCLWLVFLAGSLCVASAQEARNTEVFVGGQGGYHTYRIPSLLTAKAGSLLAFCEGRKQSAADSGDIDLLLKRSQDGGRSWGSTQVLWDDGPNTCGNPCPVLDQATGVIWLLLTHNPGHTTEHQLNLRRKGVTRTVWACSSADDGKSWSQPVNITASVKPPEWAWYATGPGIGIQIQHGPHQGRLVIPCDHSRPPPADAPPGTPTVGGSHVIYSDDHGQTWHCGGSVEPGMNECQVAELADREGSLLLNMRDARHGHRRFQAVSRDGGQSWSPAHAQPQLIESRCQASLLRYSWPTARQPGRLLFCNPAGLARTNLTVRVSYDDGQSWPKARILHAQAAAYSCLTALPDKSLGCLYENGDTNPYQRITFTRFPLSWLEGQP